MEQILTNLTKKLNTDFVREQFPALSQEISFLDNAGGAQVPQKVIDCVTNYYTNWNVQLGASYKTSAEASKKHKETAARLAQFIGAKDPKEVVVGPSTTMLLRILSLCLSEQWKPGDEVIVTNTDHEANVSCWMDLQKSGIVVKIWKVNPESLILELDGLKALLSEKTKLVTVTHVSNVLGRVNPVKEIGEVARKAGALFCVDGVAYAPHRKVNVQELGADFYVFSTYKLFGPHQAILFGRLELLNKIKGINHYFIQEVPYKFQPGNFNFELTYALNGVLDYLEDVYDFHFGAENGTVNESEKHQKTFQLIEEYEEELSKKVLAYLNKKEEVTVIGPVEYQKEVRVPTISFVHKKQSSSSIVKRVDDFNIGIRYGDFYAKKLIQDLGINTNEGVVRISLVHYNTLEEVGDLINAFEQIL